MNVSHFLPKGANKWVEFEFPIEYCCSGRTFGSANLDYVNMIYPSKPLNENTFDDSLAVVSAPLTKADDLEDHLPSQSKPRVRRSSSRIVHTTISGSASSSKRRVHPSDFTPVLIAEESPSSSANQRSAHYCQDKTAEATNTLSQVVENGLASDQVGDESSGSVSTPSLSAVSGEVDDNVITSSISPLNLSQTVKFEALTTDQGTNKNLDNNGGEDVESKQENGVANQPKRNKAQKKKRVQREEKKRGSEDEGLGEREAGDGQENDGEEEVVSRPAKMRRTTRGGGNGNGNDDNSNDGKGRGDVKKMKKEKETSHKPHASISSSASTSTSTTHITPTTTATTSPRSMYATFTEADLVIKPQKASCSCGHDSENLPKPIFFLDSKLSHFPDLKSSPSTSVDSAYPDTGAGAAVHSIAAPLPVVNVSIQIFAHTPSSAPSPRPQLHHTATSTALTSTSVSTCTSKPADGADARSNTTTDPGNDYGSSVDGSTDRGGVNGRGDDDDDHYCDTAESFCCPATAPYCLSQPTHTRDHTHANTNACINGNTDAGVANASSPNIDVNANSSRSRSRTPRKPIIRERRWSTSHIATPEDPASCRRLHRKPSPLPTYHTDTPAYYSNTNTNSTTATAHDRTPIAGHNDGRDGGTSVSERGTTTGQLRRVGRRQSLGLSSFSLINGGEHTRNANGPGTGMSSGTDRVRNSNGRTDTSVWALNDIEKSPSVPCISDECDDDDGSGEVYSIYSACDEEYNSDKELVDKKLNALEDKKKNPPRFSFGALWRLW